MIIENAEGHANSLQLSGMRVVTPSDTVDLAPPARGFRLENPAAGDTLVIQFLDGSECPLTLSELDHGYHPVGPIKKFKATGTSGSFTIIAGK